MTRKVLVQFNIDPSLLKQIDKKRRDVPRTTVITSLLRDWIEDVIEPRIFEDNRRGKNVYDFEKGPIG